MKNKKKINKSDYLKIKKNIMNNNIFLFKKGFAEFENRDIDSIYKSLNPQGRILKRSRNLLPRKFQLRLSQLIKRFREMALFPYVIIDQKE